MCNYLPNYLDSLYLCIHPCVTCVLLFVFLLELGSMCMRKPLPTCPGPKNTLQVARLVHGGGSKSVSISTYSKDSINTAMHKMCRHRPLKSKAWSKKLELQIPTFAHGFQRPPSCMNLYPCTGMDEGPGLHW